MSIGCLRQMNRNIVLHLWKCHTAGDRNSNIWQESNNLLEGFNYLLILLSNLTNSGGDVTFIVWNEYFIFSIMILKRTNKNLFCKLFSIYNFDYKIMYLFLNS